MVETELLCMDTLVLDMFFKVYLTVFNLVHPPPSSLLPPPIPILSCLLDVVAMTTPITS